MVRVFCGMVLLLLVMINSNAQVKKERIAISLKYETGRISNKNYSYTNGLDGKFLSDRKDITVDFSYPVASRIGMVSSIGISIFDSEIKYQNKDVLNYSGTDLSSVDLSLSQKIYWKVLDWNSCNNKNFGISFYPYIGLKYYQTLKTVQGANQFDNLNSQEAENWVNKYHLPAISADKNKSGGTLAFTPGLCLELSLLDRLGLFYDFAYILGFIGNTKINVDYLYNHQIYSESYKSNKCYIQHSFGLKYYF
ncbi:MAG: hypothetical protein SOR57_01555 [Parabacteroides sp.]|nr:hypothetical protein [Parabacteroides sp.]